jgi:hypothetical protein
MTVEPLLEAAELPDDPLDDALVVPLDVPLVEPLDDPTPAEPSAPDTDCAPDLLLLPHEEAMATAKRPTLIRPIMGEVSAIFAFGGSRS